MIKSFTIVNYLGEQITLDLGRPEKSGFLVKSASGLGPAKANINSTEISTSDGAVYNSARLNQRNIVLNLVFVETELGEAIEDVRQKSYKFFPLKKEVSIIAQTGNRKVRTKGYVESNEPNIFSSQEGCQVSIICPDPYWYLAEGDGITTTVFSGVEPVFEFPFGNESLHEPQIVFGSIRIKAENVIFYSGDVETGITIRIHALGEATDIIIYDSGTREVMNIDTAKIEALTGNGITAGDDIVIRTSKGEKSITLLRNGETINILNCLDKIVPWFVVKKGENRFAFSAKTGATNLQFYIENRVVYEGV